MRHGRWRLFRIRCICPWGSMMFFQCTQNLFTLNSDTNPFMCLFLHRNKYLCIFYKHGGHLRMVAYRRDRLPLSSVRLAQGSRWPAKTCAKPATDRAQLDLNPLNSRCCLLHTNWKWLAPSKGVNPYLDHAVVVSPTLDGLADWLITWPTLTNQSVGLSI